MTFSRNDSIGQVPNLMSSVTSVIIHDVDRLHSEAYEKSIEKFRYFLSQHSGFQSLDILRPVGEGMRYVVILRFESIDSAESWFKSDNRLLIINEVKPCLLYGDQYQTYVDPDFWFKAPKVNQPKRWKQFVLAWIGVLPWALSIPLIVLYLAQHIYTFPRVLIGLPISLIISWLMTYISMPFLTKKMAWWLIK